MGKRNGVIMMILMVEGMRVVTIVVLITGDYHHLNIQ
jgi:hypothetical protein